MMMDNEQKISRPRQIYTGADRREFVGLPERDQAPVPDGLMVG